LYTTRWFCIAGPGYFSYSLAFFFVRRLIQLYAFFFVRRLIQLYAFFFVAPAIQLYAFFFVAPADIQLNTNL
jgi:hypothetical protein